MRSAITRASVTRGICGISSQQINRALRVAARRGPLLRRRAAGLGPSNRSPAAQSLLPMPFGRFPLGHVPKVRPYRRAGYFGVRGDGRWCGTHVSGGTPLWGTGLRLGGVQWFGFPRGAVRVRQQLARRRNEPGMLVFAHLMNDTVQFTAIETVIHGHGREIENAPNGGRAMNGLVHRIDVVGHNRFAPRGLRCSRHDTITPKYLHSFCIRWCALSNPGSKINRCANHRALSDSARVKIVSRPEVEIIVGIAERRFMSRGLSDFHFHVARYVASSSRHNRRTSEKQGEIERDTRNMKKAGTYPGQFRFIAAAQ